jgi:hypothetical protein
VLSAGLKKCCWENNERSLYQASPSTAVEEVSDDDEDEDAAKDPEDDSEASSASGDDADAEQDKE